MKKLCIRLTPLEPYFFGGEKTFYFTDEKGNNRAAASYIARSLDTPSGATLFGTLRRLMLCGKDLFSIDEAEKERLEAESPWMMHSFSLTAHDSYRFYEPMIGGISPLYIFDGEHFLIKAPFDNNLRESDGAYHPFEKYEAVQTNEGVKTIPLDFVAKRGIDTSRWMYRGGKGNAYMLADGLFLSTMRVGIQKGGKENAFYKKEYRMLKSGCSFAFFATVDEGIAERLVGEHIVHLGQNRSAFKAEIDDCHEEPSVAFDHGIVYAMSDLYLPNREMETLFGLCAFSVTEAHSYRAFTTAYGQGRGQNLRYNKSSTMVRLLSAGSIFKVKDGKEAEFRLLFEGEFSRNAHMAGYNSLIYSVKELREE